MDSREAAPTSEEPDVNGGGKYDRWGGRKSDSRQHVSRPAEPPSRSAVLASLEPAECPLCHGHNVPVVWPRWQRVRSMDEWEKTHCWTCRTCHRDWEVKTGARGRRHGDSPPESINSGSRVRAARVRGSRLNLLTGRLISEPSIETDRRAGARVHRSSVARSPEPRAR